MPATIRHLDLFSGIGGFAYAADQVFGDVEHIFCDNDKFCQQVLNKHWPEAKIYDDIRAITDTEDAHWRSRKLGQKQTAVRPQRNDKSSGSGTVDILTGGFPCQPFSAAGLRRGTADDRHLWPEMLRVIRLTRPIWIIAENVRGLLTWNEGLVFEQVCIDLEAEGYEVQPFIIPAVAVNAPHRRDRVWFVAHRQSDRTQGGVLKQDPNAGLDENAIDATNTKSRQSGQPSQWQRRQDTGCGSRAGDDTDPTNEGLEGAGQAGDGYGGQSDREQRYQGPDWTKNWLEVAGYLLRMDDGISTWMDRYFGEIIKGDDYAITRNANKEMRLLQKAVQQESLQERMGRLFPLFKTEVLLSFLQHLQEKPVGKGIKMEGEKGNTDGELRGLWDFSRFDNPSQKRKSIQQRSEELTSLVPGLSYEVAQCISENYYRLACIYSAVDSQPVELDGFELTKAGHRVQRLKSLGNAIVPQVAMEIMKGML